MGHVGDVYDECNSPDQREGTLYLYTLTRSWFDEPPDFLLLCLVKDVMVYFCSLNQKVTVPVKRRSCCLQLCYGTVLLHKASYCTFALPYAELEV
jgi:hypothetical protein